MHPRFYKWVSTCLCVCVVWVLNTINMCVVWVSIMQWQILKVNIKIHFHMQKINSIAMAGSVEFYIASSKLTHFFDKKCVLT